MPGSAIWLGLVRALALVLGGLGLLFLFLPEPASALFGIATQEETALAYVRGLGLRDIALCLYLLLLARRPGSGLRPVLAASLVIPAGDLVLVLAASGLSAPLPLALHAASGICLAALAFWPRRAD